MHTHTVKTATLDQRVIEAGSGPLVVLIHGFPELSISWRAQVRALAEAGYRAVAPDMRGYGGTTGPGERTQDHTLPQLVEDTVALVAALGETRAVVVGHDWGAPVAWNCALMRPDMFRAVAGLSVPFQPRSDSGPPIPAMRALAQRVGRGELYIVRFQEMADQIQFDADPAAALRKCFWSYDGATPAADRATGFIPAGLSLMESVSDDAVLPPWMGADLFAEYVAAFSARGFKQPMDWYRCMDLNWERMADLQGRKITVPALFMVGEHDPARHYSGRHEKTLGDWATDLRGNHVIAGAAHWLQQERPDQVNRLLLDFLAGLDA